MADVATVKIVNEKADGEYIIINKDDFDPKEHKLFTEKALKKEDDKLDKLNLEQLKEFAAANKIELPAEAKLKEDIVKVIKTALEAKKAAE